MRAFFRGASLAGILRRRTSRQPAPNAPGSKRWALLFATGNAAVARAVEEALSSASIPFATGLQSLPQPQTVFSVPEDRIEEATAVVGQFFGKGPLASPAADEPEREEPARRFPREALGASGAIVLAHLAVLAFNVGRHPDPARLAKAGGLVTGAGAPEAWRLLTYPFVHADLAHVLWNGVAMFVFAAPLLDRIGRVRTALLYVAGSVVGGAAALQSSARGTVTVGSSAAVAALFGAWVVLSIREGSRASLRRRAVVRALGIGLLALPPLLTPFTTGGARVSVAAHLGGLVAGICGGLGIRGAGAQIRDEGTTLDPSLERRRDPRSPS